MSALREITRQALEGLLQERLLEPVAWMNGSGDLFKNPDEAERGQTLTPLYASPPQRKPLSDEDIERAYRHIYRNLPYEFDHSTRSWIEQGIRYAEQAHRINYEYQDNER